MRIATGPAVLVPLPLRHRPSELRELRQRRRRRGRVGLRVSLGGRKIVVLLLLVMRVGVVGGNVGFGL